MTAADHKIIIEKGADFVIETQVKDGGVSNKDLTGFTVSMELLYDNNGTITIQGVYPGVVTDTVNGILAVTIDKDVTATLDTRITTEQNSNVFATEYNYFYHIDISNSSTDEDFRVLRGKAAVRL